MVPFRIERLDNTIRVEFYDQSNRYFGDFYRIHILVRCRLPLSGNLLEEALPPIELERARTLLDGEVVLERSLEKMGVSGTELDRTRKEMTEGFVRTALPYMAAPSFPARLVKGELERKRKGNRPWLIR